MLGPCQTVSNSPIDVPRPALGTTVDGSSGLPATNGKHDSAGRDATRRKPRPSSTAADSDTSTTPTTPTTDGGKGVSCTLPSSPAMGNGASQPRVTQRVWRA